MGLGQKYFKATYIVCMSIWLSNLLILSVPDEDYSQNVSCALHLYICYLRFYYYHCMDTSVGDLLVPEGIICPVGSASALTWFITYIYYWNLQFLNNVIINKGNAKHGVSPCLKFDLVTLTFDLENQ